MPSGLISMSRVATGSSSTAMASSPNETSERPWNERDQSTCSEGEAGEGGAVGRGSLRPLVRFVGVGFAVLGLGADGDAALAAAAVVALRTEVAESNLGVEGV
jgi:hypothetical protein